MHQVIAICDQDRTVWNNFGHPHPDTIFLLDENGRITATSSLENADSVVMQSQRMANELEQMHEPRFT
jgi:hypothetical protein